MKSSAARPPGRLRRRLSREARERQLIEAVIRCISVLGLGATTVPDVAARAGMAVGSINQYFGSKERLLTAALRAISAQFEATWRAALESAGPDPALRLRRFVESYFESSTCQRSRIAVWFAFWGEARARPRYREVCAAYDRRHDAALESLCRALIEAGGYRIEPWRAAKIIASQCHGLWLELLTGADHLDRNELAGLARSNLAALFPRHRAILERTGERSGGA